MNAPDQPEPRREPETLRAILEDGIKDLGGTHRQDLALALDELVHAAAPTPEAAGLRERASTEGGSQRATEPLP